MKNSGVITRNSVDLGLPLPDLATSSMYLAVLVFRQGPDWDLVTIHTTHPLVFRFYVLLVLVSVAVALANICRNWILLPPFRQVRTNAAYHAASTFRRQVLSLRRWMILNTSLGPR